MQVARFMLSRLDPMRIGRVAGDDPKKYAVSPRT